MENIIEKQVAAYELQLAGMDARQLKAAIRKSGISVKLNVSKDAMRVVLAKRRRWTLEHEAEVAALEALPELPALCPFDADELLDSGERAAVYLKEDLAQRGMLNGDHRFNLMR